MRFFQKLMREKNDDPLRGQAERLVSSAIINATSMFVPMLDQHPLLKTVKPEDWDFFLTIAGVFIAVSRLEKLQVSNNRKQELRNVVARALTDRSPENGFRGFEDCKAMFERNFDALTRIQHEPRFIASDAVGVWIVWNLLGRPSESEEARKLVRAVGVGIVQSFFSWWDAP
jgi:hypothetical protein